MAVVGLSLLWFGATDAVAQQPVFDHLKCYTVTGDHHQFKKHEVDLLNQQFGEEQCTLVDHAKFFCAPTQKKSVDGHPPNSPFPTQALDPTQDFICYSVSCVPKNQKHSFGATDQFAQREMTITNAKLFCAPARKNPAD
jgi:hypothetical protein